MDATDLFVVCLVGFLISEISAIVCLFVFLVNELTPISYLPLGTLNFFGSIVFVDCESTSELF